MDEPDVDSKQRWTALLANYEPFDEPVSRKTYIPPGWNSQNAIAEISEDVYNKIVSLGAGTSVLRLLDAESLSVATKEEGLLIDSAVMAAIVAALNSRKNIIPAGGRHGHRNRRRSETGSQRSTASAPQFALRHADRSLICISSSTPVAKS